MLRQLLERCCGRTVQQSYLVVPAPHRRDIAEIGRVCLCCAARALVGVKGGPSSVLQAWDGRSTYGGGHYGGRRAWGILCRLVYVRHGVMKVSPSCKLFTLLRLYNCRVSQRFNLKIWNKPGTRCTVHSRWGNAPGFAVWPFSARCCRQWGGWDMVRVWGGQLST